MAKASTSYRHHQTLFVSNVHKLYSIVPKWLKFQIESDDVWRTSWLMKKKRKPGHL